jgi:hypothetical protein
VNGVEYRYKVRKTNKNFGGFTMNMLLNPITNEIIAEDMFQGVTNWQSIEFVELTNCEEVVTESGFALTGQMNGETFKVEMSQEDYFEGKFFSLVEEVVLTEENVKEELETIEGVGITTKNLFSLQTVEINGVKVLDYRIEKQNNLITVFPHVKHFFSTNILELNIDEFTELVEIKVKEFM